MAFDRMAKLMFEDPLNSVASDAAFDRVQRFCFNNAKHLTPHRDFLAELYVFIDGRAKSKFSAHSLVFGLTEIQEMLIHKDEVRAGFVVLAGKFALLLMPSRI